MNRKKIAYIITILVIISFLQSLFLAFTYLELNRLKHDYTHLYELDIKRESDDDLTLDLIYKAEGFEYTEIFNDTPRDDGPVLMLKEIEPRANFIDSENINYYTGRIEDLKDSETYGQYKLKYQASITHYDRIIFKLKASDDPDQSMKTGLYYGYHYKSLWSGMNSHLLYHNGSDLVKVNPQSPYPRDETEIHYYNDSYVIEMELEYSAKPDRDEGGGFDLKQFVVLDSEGNLKFFFNFRYDSGVLNW